MILDDRRDEYINKNLSLCEYNCYKDNYDFKSKTTTCTCSVKTKSRLYSDIYIDTFKLMNNFKNIKSISNIYVMKCLNLLFNINAMKKNIGSYIILIIILIHIIALFFVNKEYKNLYDRIKTIIIEILEEKKIVVKRKRSIKNKKIILEENSSSKIFGLKNNKELKPKSFIDTTKRKIPSINIINIKETSIFDSNDTIINYNDNELNNLTYNEALKIDKRNYFKYYISLLKTKHPLIFTFYTKNDYNLKSMKICLFSFSFGLFYTVNALFFDEATIHKIYEDKGAFNLIYKIPKILYSTIISHVINIIATTFSLSENNIIELKHEKIKTKENFNKLIKILILKFILYFLFAFIFLILFWIYLSCFCIVYSNSQIQLLKDTLISFCFSLIYPFFIKLLPGIFRTLSINNGKENKECIFKLSKLIQLF